MSKSDLYSEIVAATRMILDGEGLSHVDVRIKLDTYATYAKGKDFIQYGSKSIEAKLDASSGMLFEAYAYEGGKLRKYYGEIIKQLTAKEKIASVIIEETAHSVAYSEGYHGKHGGYFNSVFIKVWVKYYDRVTDMLKCVSKYEVVSITDILARSKRLEWKIKEAAVW